MNDVISCVDTFKLFLKVFDIFEIYLKNQNSYNFSHDFELDRQVENILFRTIRYFGKNSANALTNWSTGEGSPFHQHIKINKNKLTSVLPNDLIRNYFLNKVIRIKNTTFINEILATQNF